MRVEDFLRDSAVRFPDKTALVCEDRRCSYAWLDARAGRLARHLAARGVRRGDRVVICLENSVEAVIAIFGVLGAGAVFVVAGAATRPERLAYLLDDSGATALIARTARFTEAGPVAERAGRLALAVAVGATAGGGSLPPATLDWEALLAAQTDAQSVDAGAPTFPGIDLDLAALIYTSGSTGHPKGVMLTHQNMVVAARSTVQYLGATGDDVVASILPLSHSYGLYQVLDAFLVGATVVLEKSFAYPHEVLRRMCEERATGLAIIPTTAAILRRLDLAPYPLRTLRYLTCAGAGLPPEHTAWLRARFPDAALFLMYGLTECKRVSYLPPDQVDRRPDSVGRAMPNVEVRIVDEALNPVPPGMVGELLVRGANVMRGYWKLEAETARALVPGPVPGERMLRTGDLFRMDDEGWLYFVGRRDDIIRSGGEKISPAEIENVLARLPGISQAAVVGVPDPLLGAVVRAVVTLDDGARLDENDVRRHCARHLEDFMVPKQVEFRAALPRNEAGKIDRRSLAGGEAA